MAKAGDLIALQPLVKLNQRVEEFVFGTGAILHPGKGDLVHKGSCYWTRGCIGLLAVFDCANRDYPRRSIRVDR